MESCPNCGRLYSGEYCANCNVGSPEYKQDFPNVSWAEVRDHLVKRLLIDQESIVHGEDEYRWWPAFLCQRVFKEAEGRFIEASPDNWMEIVAETEIGRMDDELGSALADAINSEFVHGAAIYNEGLLKLRTSFAFNPLNRSLLKVFHEFVLAQATIAHEIAIKWKDIEGIEFAYSQHPESGARDTWDDLLGVFWGDEYSGGEILPDFQTALDKARTLIPQIMEKEGWNPGFSNEDVAFFTLGNASVGMGLRPADPENLKYGPGIYIYANDLNYQHSLEVEQSNFMNFMASELESASQLGSFVSKNYIGESAARVTSFIPYGPLAENRFNPLDIAILITNLATHVSNSCMGAFWLVNEATKAKSSNFGDDDRNQAL